MDVHRPRPADPRRAHPRHRRRRQVRDLRDHPASSPRRARASSSSPPSCPSCSASPTASTRSSKAQITDELPVARGRPRNPHADHDLLVTESSRVMSAPVTDAKRRGVDIRDLEQDVRRRRDRARQFGILGALVVDHRRSSRSATGGMTLQPGNLINIVSQYSYILILAIGMVMVIIAGHIDLSVGSVAAFAGIIVAKAMQRLERSRGRLGASCSASSSACWSGAWQGFWVAYVGVPAFIVTLAGMLIFRGGNQFDRQLDTVPVPDGFQVIGARLPARGRARHRASTTSTMLLGLARRRLPSSSARDPRRVARRRKMGSRRGAALGQRRQGRAARRRRSCFAACLFATGRVGHELPGLGHHPRRPRARLLLHHEQHHRSAVTSTPSAATARRRALGRQGPRGSTSSS